jgi:hypothetical protein
MCILSFARVDPMVTESCILYVSSVASVLVLILRLFVQVTYLDAGNRR